MRFPAGVGTDFFSCSSRTLCLRTLRSLQRARSLKSFKPSVLNDCCCCRALFELGGVGWRKAGSLPGTFAFEIVVLPCVYAATTFLGWFGRALVGWAPRAGKSSAVKDGCCWRGVGLFPGTFILVTSEPPGTCGAATPFRSTGGNF